MSYLVPRTNYKGYNGRVQLSERAICCRARLPKQDRGRNKAGALADPDQLWLCRHEQDVSEDAEIEEERRKRRKEPLGQREDRLLERTE